ncbi:MAG: Type 1 glutamine amidotransferase-like domain-containing protein [Candidatus Nanoarchaeia archaeon]|nr:Type 1 glutamine amidotransferase-like domain-containing protein [Candidatus Nanoarchaeia archaeon]
MKLLLTSDGLTSNALVDAFKELAIKPLKKLKVLIVSTGPNTQKILGYIEEFKKPLITAGVKENRIKTLLLSEPSNTNLSEYDILFVCGGNTFSYLYLIKRLGMDTKIKEFVKKGIYIGVSAGSILPGPSITSSSATNNTPLKDYTGLKIVNFTIIPHMNEEDEKKIKQDVKESKINYDYYIIKDGQGVLVKDKQVRLIK